jgi:RNA polymerase sigma factor (TIGR02999 family)
MAAVSNVPNPEGPWALFGSAYADLKRLAAIAMRREMFTRTMQRTALVHEAFLRMLGDRELRWENRSEFFIAAANQMHQILIECARKRQASKRWGDLRRVALEEDSVPVEQVPEKLFHVSQAVERLGRVDARAAQIVEMRFFAGLSSAEIAEFLGVSEKTVERDWLYARAWLRRAISE